MLRKVSASKTILATGDYVYNDVMSEGSNQVGTAWTFSNPALSDGKGGWITGAHITFSKTGGITALATRLCLLLYKAMPTSQLYDNYPNTGCIAADVNNYIGRINFPALSEAGGSPDAIAGPSTYGNLPLPFVCATNDNAIYGILVTLAAETGETASTVATIDLYIEQDH